MSNRFSAAVILPPASQPRGSCKDRVFVPSIGFGGDEVPELARKIGSLPAKGGLPHEEGATCSMTSR